MRAWLVREFGAPERVLRLEEVPEPEATPESLVLSIVAAGLNFPDALFIQGRYQVKPRLPFIPGFEAVGRVVALGEDCQGPPVGQRVVCRIPQGAFAESVRVLPEQVFEAPPGMPDDEAAGFLMTYQTAYFALVHRAGLRAGEVLLVTGASGGVGSAAVQLGKALGATVIAAAAGSGKIAFCQAQGADHLVDYGQEDLVDRVKEAAPQGVDVVLDPVGGEAFDLSTKCLAWEGRIVTLGFTSGTVPSIAAHRILLKNISVIGLHWSQYIERDPTLVRECHRQLIELYSQGWIRPAIGHCYPMESLPDGLSAFAARQVLGKSIVWIQ